ncbi:hypothetical protein BGX29_000403 [Mortierella sp. GBA35]|nr:hypothetical protein BGX29_000403 [Mortierella sp. GBA35]
MFNNQPRPEDVVRLPEIVALLGPYLKAPDLFSCIQVCHLWNDLLTPWLWRTIDDSAHSWPTILANHKNPEQQGHKDADWIRAIFAKYGHHIRELTSQWGVILEVANMSGTCNRLESLSVGDLSTSKTLDDKEDDAHTGAIDSNGDSSNGTEIYRYRGPRQESHHEAVTGPLLSPIFEGVLTPHQAQYRTVARQKQDWATSQHFWLLVRQNSRSLFSLRLHVSLMWLCQITKVDFVFDTLASLENLVNLENDLMALDVNTLLERVPSLVSYRTWVHYVQNDYAPRRQFTQLVYLQLFGAVSTRTFFTLLKYFPTLETLRMDEFRGSMDFLTNAYEILDNTPSKLKRLHFYNPSTTIDEHIANLVIPWIPNLVEISLSQLHPAIARALGTHCRKLEIVRQADDGHSIHPSTRPNPLVNMVGVLLRECASLKVFDGIHHKLEASHMLKYPWACRLETLRCQIIGIPRLTKTQQEFLASTSSSSNDTDIYTPPPPAPPPPSAGVLFSIDNGGDNIPLTRSELLAKQQQCLEVQHKVMDYLAGFTSLKVLDLGYEYRDIAVELYNRSQDPDWPLKHPGNPTFQSLELTLASGLDRLSALTRLEIFGFEGVDHRIGKKELDWMAVNWPKLKILRGLQKDDELPDPVGDPERTELREYMQELRVDVRHATKRPAIKSMFEDNN